MKMKLLMESWDKFINESSLNRTLQHLEEHDCAIITAYRKDPTDDRKCVAGFRANVGDTKKFQMKQQNNTELFSMLKSLNYGITGVLGTYIENYGTEDAVEVKEHSYFVVNSNDEPDFFSKIEELGLYFCQDSVLLSPKGGKSAYLLGTNNADFPGLGQKDEIGRFIGGDTGEFMTRVQNRTYVFKVKD